MKKCKVLTALNAVHLEEFVNEFLETLGGNQILDLQFVVPDCVKKDNPYQFYHAMITYDK